jgi:hypothetical protein
VNRQLVALCLVAFGISIQPRTLRAQAPATSVPPILPMEISFRYVPQYFEQSISNDPQYSRIEARVDQDRCDVVLFDKTSLHEDLYSTIKRSGTIAARIQCAQTSSSDAHLVFQFDFKDRFGQDVNWQFFAGEVLRQPSENEVVFLGDISGATLCYAPNRAAAIAGTSLAIAGRNYRPLPAQSDTAPAFYANDMTIAKISAGTSSWAIQRGVDDQTTAEEWDLQDDRGRQRSLSVQQVSATQIDIDQLDLNDPDAIKVTLSLESFSGAWGLRTVSCKSHGDAFWIFFGSSVPVLATKIHDEATVAFTVAENDHATIARGVIVAKRADAAEHFVWQFNAPISAAGATVETDAACDRRFKMNGEPDHAQVALP